VTKKNVRLTKDIAKKDKGYIPGGLDDLIKEVKNKEDEGNIVRMNFEVSEKLRNAFKSKIASEGKKVKDVFATFMKQYITNE
jgi:hypothetical protein